MRSFGIILLITGVLGFFYCGDQAKRYDPLPEGTSAFDSLETPGGRWEVGRYACALGAGLGFLLALFPKGR